MSGKRGRVPQIIGFQNGGTAAGYVLFGADAQGHAVQQGGGVRPAGENGPKQVAGQLRGRGGVALFAVDRLLRERPDREGFPLVKGGPHDLQIFGVFM